MYKSSINQHTHTDTYRGRSFETEERDDSLSEFTGIFPTRSEKQGVVILTDTGYLLGNREILFDDSQESAGVVYVVHRPQIYDAKSSSLKDTFAFELATKENVVSLIVDRPKDFVHYFNMSRKIAGETSSPVILYATFGANAKFPKEAFQNDAHNDFVVPESYYAHRTTRSVREIMDSYSFKGFEVKRGLNTLSILSRSSTSENAKQEEESKAETKETKGSSSFDVALKCLNLDLLHESFFQRYVSQGVDVVVSNEYDRERVSKFLDHHHNIKAVRVVVSSQETTTSSITIWEHPEEKASISVLTRLDSSVSSVSSSTDTICPDEVRCRRTILHHRHHDRHVHVFTSTALAKQFAARHVSNRRNVTVLFNMPYVCLNITTTINHKNQPHKTTDTQHSSWSKDSHQHSQMHMFIPSMQQPFQEYSTQVWKRCLRRPCP